MLAQVKRLLGHHRLYVALQRGVGADRLRYRCLDELRLADGDTVIDVGCGPAYYFARLPKVRYFGFDTSPHYIEHARRLPDEESRHLLRVSARALAPGGRVISVDPCFEPNQGRISRWMSENDRGEHVRTPEAFVALAREAFEEVDGEVIDDATRIPSSHWMMLLCKPAPS